MSKIFNEKDAKKIFDGFDSYTQDDADKVMNFPVLTYKDKSISTASTLKKGGSGGNVSSNSLKSAKDEKAKAVNYKADKVKSPSWKVAFGALKNLKA